MEHISEVLAELEQRYVEQAQPVSQSGDVSLLVEAPSSQESASAA